ncbi:hypothetical protein O181_051934 [Austropuccinia psidii MF-1]|uniref:Gfo/Idh/MocA-like oxidoreductase N-terminal domain-containing protein n=1 Tax=Austropuccinia psidii MF-1 TaxID=1389203 RepID=A0A9Q3DZR0_9BASI|nr:hypothetical protein [Austropuccinia psidii MF-1]
MLYYHFLRVKPYRPGQIILDKILVKLPNPRHLEIQVPSISIIFQKNLKKSFIHTSPKILNFSFNLTSPSIMNAKNEKKTSFGSDALASPVQPSNRSFSLSNRKPSIDPARLGNMHALDPNNIVNELKSMTLKGNYNILFIGAGNINFGCDEGPWNHSVRLEHKLQTRLKVVGIIDPDLNRSQQVLKLKCASFVERAYQNAHLCKSLDEFVEKIKPEEKPRAIIIGSPAQFHGSNLPGQDLELQCLKHFPLAALFVEKPISCAPCVNSYALADVLDQSKSVVSVGYMLRYLQVIQHMQRIIAQTGKPVMMVVARYVCSYAKIRSQVWWNKSKSLGPIVEQGTHLVDLCRYIGGEAILDSVQAVSTEHYEEAGKLENIPIDESKIPSEHRVPRTTSALWKFNSGAVCSFSHALTLQGTKYSTELEVYLDGWQLKVVDLYNDPVLYVRSPEADSEQRVTFPADDPYFGEISAWIDATEANISETAIAEDDEDDLPNGILSDFRDACGTYALTWAIKEASERSLKTASKP